MKYGKKLYSIRRRRELARWKVAKMTGIPESRLRYIELFSPTISRDELNELLDFYGLTEEELFDGQVRA